jgi:hypothetical protein
LTLVLPLLAGCPPPPIEPSQDVNQDAILQEYAALHDGETDRTTVEAQFWFGAGGTTLQLSPPSTVMHNVLELRLDSSFGAKYVGTGVGFVDFHEWTWTDTEGKVFVNTLTMEPIRFVDPPARISRSQVAIFAFEPPLGDGEGVSLDDAEDGGLTLVALTFTPGATAVALTPEAMEHIPASRDSLVVELIRGKGFLLEAATSRGGSMNAESRSEHITVIVDP